MPRTFVIGDIHGGLAQFDALLDAIALTAEDHLILLGDLIDRGPESAGVLKRVRSLTNRVTVIRGNHEQMMVEARDSHSKYASWIRNGGDATLRSYRGLRGTFRDVPLEDWEFLSHQLVDYFEDDTHIFIHANAYPDMAMNEQPEYMLRWERCDGMMPHRSGKTIICGHTPQMSGRPLNLGYAICLDTAAGHGGPLTCMEIGCGKIWQATTDGRVGQSHISDYSGV